MRNEDEVEVGSLRIEVRGVRHAHGVRAALDIIADTLVQAVQVIPRDAGLQSVDQDAVIAKVLAHVRLGVAGLFPLFWGIPAQ